MRVVIADDHSFFRTGLETVLAKHGIEVAASVADGNAALDAIAIQSPDLAILDLRMPGKNGVETLKSLREHGNALPVVILAAEFEGDSLMQAVDAGANAIVSKTSENDSLFHAIAAVQSGGQYFEQGYLDRYIAAKGSQFAASTSSDPRFSAREEKIVQGVVNGLRNREIAELHGFSEAMVKLHLHRIYDRLGLTNRTELALLVRSGHDS